jgi:hypothetical protein
MKFPYSFFHKGIYYSISIQDFKNITFYIQIRKVTAMVLHHSACSLNNFLLFRVKKDLSLEVFDTIL